MAAALSGTMKSELGLAAPAFEAAAARPRRILMVSSVPLAAPWNGGDKNLARTLVGRDVYNHYVVQTGAADVWPAPRVTAIRSHHASAMPTPDQKLRALGFVVRHSREVDIIHIVASLNQPTRWIGRVLRLWSALSGKPMVHTIPSLGDLPLDRHDFFADATVVLSQYAHDRLEAHGVKDVYRVFPPLELEELRPRSSPAELARELRLGQRAVLYAAHYGDRSGIAETVKAFACLPPSLNDAVLVLASRVHRWQNRADEDANVLGLARSLGIADRLRIVDQVDDMFALIRASAVSALVPEHLGGKMDLPLVILESQALERPVIVSDVAPINESVLGGGVAVPFGDVDALARALTELLTNRERSRQLGRLGRVTVRELCDPDRVTQQYRQVYARVAASRVKAAGRRPFGSQ